MTDTQSKYSVRGACPGAGSSMVTGDGLLSRVRIPGGRLKASQLRVLAKLVDQWAQPVLELTGRGNIQIRGLAPNGDAQMTAALIEHKLAAAPAAAEAVRNVLSTPAADLDPTALIDPWPIAQALEQALLGDESFWALPGKFRIVVDGGGATGLAQQAADIRADAVATADGGIGYRLALAGNALTAHPLGNCRPDQVTAAVLALTRRFMQLSSPPSPRLADVLATAGIAAFRPVCGALTRLSVPANYPSLAILGAKPGWFGAALPFGQLTTDTAIQLATLAERKAKGELRITPWRQVLLPGAEANVAPTLQELGLITAYGDPRLSMNVCPGAPACLSGSTPTRDHALAWVDAVPELFDGERVIHVSGCGKGCARPMASPLTLTARNGRYDLILNDRADPQREENCALRGLTFEEVVPALRMLAATLKQQRRPGESLTQVIERL